MSALEMTAISQMTEKGVTESQGAQKTNLTWGKNRSTYGLGEILQQL